MKNKNKWLLTSNTDKGIKHVKPCPNLMGKDQFVLFMNGHLQKGVKDYEGIISLIGSLYNCTECPYDCSICLTVNEYTPDVSLTLNMNSSMIILYSAEIYYNSLNDVEVLTEGAVVISEQLVISLSDVNYLIGNEQRELYIYGYNNNGKCIVKKIIINTKTLSAGVTEFDLATFINDISASCSNGTFNISAISLPENSSISVNTDTWIVTLIDTTTAIENRFILGIYCDECLVGLYTVHTK